MLHWPKQPSEPPPVGFGEGILARRAQLGVGKNRSGPAALFYQRDTVSRRIPSEFEAAIPSGAKDTKDGDPLGPLAQGFVDVVGDRLEAKDFVLRDQTGKGLPLTDHESALAPCFGIDLMVEPGCGLSSVNAGSRGEIPNGESLQQ